MQRFSTQTFIYASLAFGIIGILMVLTMPSNDNLRTEMDIILNKALFITVFVILTSFALSVAGRYLTKK